MTRILTSVALLVCSLVLAQGNFEASMGKALGLWKESKPTEASALFERIAAAEKTNWLPTYYVGLVNVTEAFNPANSEKATLLIEKAQKATDLAMEMSPNNAEILVLQNLVYTALIIQDPMGNGMKYSGIVMELYRKAMAIAPSNPRVVFSKADFEMGGAKWTGADVNALCKEIERSIELFNNFKPESTFHPKWGLERAQQSVANCKK